MHQDCHLSVLCICAKGGAMALVGSCMNPTPHALSFACAKVRLFWRTCKLFIALFEILLKYQVSSNPPRTPSITKGGELHSIHPGCFSIVYRFCIGNHL